MRVAALFFAVLAAVALTSPQGWAQDRTDSTYTVKSGDTLYGIAQKVGASVQALKQWNDLETASLQVGQTLRVRPPTEPSADRDESERSDEAEPETEIEEGRADTTSASEPRPYGRHDVEVGDTFVTLALRLGTTADSLFTLNDSTTASLAPGQSLRLPLRFGPPTHRVQSGQTLYDIAGEYGVSVRALKVENDLDTNTIERGQRLQIPRGAFELPAAGEWAEPDSTGRVAIYPPAFAGRLTASGMEYDPDDFVVSHPSLPYNSVVLLSARSPEHHTFARVIDRGPIEEGVLLDVSKAVAQQLRLNTDEVSRVELRVVWREQDSN